MPRITIASVTDQAKAMGLRLKKERQSNGVTVWFLTDKEGQTVAHPDGTLMHLSAAELHDTLSRLSSEGEERR